MPSEGIVLPFTPEAVVFDLDGLLVDSEPVWEEAERSVVASFGGRWTPRVRDILLGMGPMDAATALAALLGVDDPWEVERRMVAAAVERFTPGVPLRPGAERLVRGLRGRLPLAVATNSRRVIADLALTNTGLASALDAVVAAEDVARGKPHPDPYERACHLLGAPPSRVVALEDSPLGVRSARAAGCWVIGCPSIAGIGLPEAHASVVSLEALDVDLLAPYRGRASDGARLRGSAPAGGGD